MALENAIGKPHHSFGYCITPPCGMHNYTPAWSFGTAALLFVKVSGVPLGPPPLMTGALSVLKALY